VVGAGNSGTEIAVDLADGGARRVRIAVRTPPNILRRDTKGFPTQLVGIAFQRLPSRLLDPMIRVLRRATIPDLSDRGLLRPSDPFSEFAFISLESSFRSRDCCTRLARMPGRPPRAWLASSPLVSEASGESKEQRSPWAAGRGAPMDCTGVGG
jgi:hypothetical protein